MHGDQTGRDGAKKQVKEENGTLDDLEHNEDGRLAPILSPKPSHPLSPIPNHGQAPTRTPPGESLLELMMLQISLAIVFKRIGSLSAQTPTAHHRYCEPECRLRVG